MEAIRVLPTLRILLLLPFVIIFRNAQGDNGDDYPVAPGNDSLLVALGCFWCAEQAFEQYAPGVVEAVAGYAGAEGNENPNYLHHPGHYEVVLVEYDPRKTTYELLVAYAWRNLDPFDSNGQFCDEGSSYRPAIFHATDEERSKAEAVREGILASRPEWDPATVAVPLLRRPKFWEAEEYHQNYYAKKPEDYGYYKRSCGRTTRLKSVWGKREYACYHDLEASCFGGRIVNEEGDEVDAEVNRKDVPEEVAGALPQWAIITLVVGVLLICRVSCYLWHESKRRRQVSMEEVERKCSDG